jgi:demethylmenaquinone methyltransferase / 2-methoxy-6-polyprenyl-1,4-benzoquinol methylase
VEQALGEATEAAQSLFAPIGPTYDRYARVLSFGQDPRWRSFLVSRVEAAPGQSVLDVASGTGAVAIELARRYGCSVVGIDQSAEMLAAGRRRVETAGVGGFVRLQQGRAESLPFEDESFDAVTFTYLLRYVDEPAATLRELARVLRPGGRLASLEFFVPPNPAARAAWELYVRFGLPLAGSVVSPGWGRVGRFLGPSIRAFYERLPLPELLGLWRAAGVGDPRYRPLSLGGGIVVWGDRDR